MRAKSRRLKGGEIIGRGADTCVFQPKLACADPTVNFKVDNEEKTSGNTQVSRIMSSREGVKENKAEAQIREVIKEYKSRGLLNQANVIEQSFLINSEFQCSNPIFRPEDLAPPELVSSCFAKRTFTEIAPGVSTLDQISKQSHLYAPKFDDDFYNLLMKKKGELFYVNSTDLYLYIKQLMNACLLINSKTFSKLFVHSDLHMGNVGIQVAKKQVKISDFGRTRIIEKRKPTQSLDSYFIDFVDVISSLKYLFNNLVTTDYKSNPFSQTNAQSQCSPELAVLKVAADCYKTKVLINIENWGDDHQIISRIYEISEGLHTELDPVKIQELKKEFIDIGFYILTFEDAFAVLRGIQRITRNGYLRDLLGLQKYEYQNQKLTQEIFLDAVQYFQNKRFPENIDTSLAKSSILVPIPASGRASGF